jgi:hypothetical protein
MRISISGGNLNVIEILEQLREDLNLLPEQTKEYAKKIFYSNEVRTFIVEANLRLLQQGLRPDLTPIEKIPKGRQTSKFYERWTIYNRSHGEMGYEESQTQFVDLYKTGFFYKSIKVKAGSEDLIETSDDPKAAELERIWGQILGISSEDLNELIAMIRPKLVTFVKSKLKIKR